MKEYNIDLKVALTDVKEYWTNENSDIICSGSLKDSLFILANNFGLKCPETFGILSCNHFLSQYSHIEKVSLFIEEFGWNRISYDGVNFHNHAFIHKPDCKRTCTVTLNRKG
jgi:urate oxidase